MNTLNATNPSVPVISPVTVFVCTQCGMGPCNKAAGEKPKANPLARTFVMAIRKALEPNLHITVRLSRCLGPCQGPLAYAFTGAGRETILFTGGQTTIPPETVAAAAITYQTKRPGSRFKGKEMPAELLPTVIARIPAPLKAPFKTKT